MEKHLQRIASLVRNTACAYCRKVAAGGAHSNHCTVDSERGQF